MVLPYQLPMIGHIKVGDFQLVSDIAKLHLVFGKKLFLHTDAVVAFCLWQLFQRGRACSFSPLKRSNELFWLYMSRASSGLAYCFWIQVAGLPSGFRDGFEHALRVRWSIS